MRNERNHNRVKSAYSEFAVSTRRARTSWWSIIRYGDFRKRRMILERKREETSVFIDRGGCNTRGVAVTVEHRAPIFTSVCPAPVDVSSLRKAERLPSRFAPLMYTLTMPVFMYHLCSAPAGKSHAFAEKTSSCIGRTMSLLAKTWYPRTILD